MSFTQHRRYPRARLNYGLVIEFNSEQIAVITADFGMGGALIHTAELLPVGTPLKVHLSNNNGTGSATAQVVRQNRQGFAIKFLEHSEDFTAVLVEVVSPHLTEDAWNEVA